MKQIIFIIALLIVGIAGASAQESQDNNSESRWNFGARAGINFTHDKDINATSNVGFDCEFLSDFHLRNKLYFRTGLGFREFRQKWTPRYSEYYTQTSPNKQVGNTIYLPLRLAWKLPLGTNFKLDLETGTFLSYGIGGKSKCCFNGDKHDTFESGFKNRYNYGIDCGAGISFKNYYIGVSGTFSNRNITPGYIGAVKLGYTFK